MVPFFFCLICSCLPSKMSDEQSVLFINDITAEKQRMRLYKEGKKTQKDEEGGKVKVY